MIYRPPTWLYWLCVSALSTFVAFVAYVVLYLHAAVSPTPSPTSTPSLHLDGFTTTHSIRFESDSQPIVTLYPDGRVVIPVGVTDSSAAVGFWDAVRAAGYCGCPK